MLGVSNDDLDQGFIQTLKEFVFQHGLRHRFHVNRRAVLHQLECPTAAARLLKHLRDTSTAGHRRVSHRRRFQILKHYLGPGAHVYESAASDRQESRHGFSTGLLKIQLRPHNSKARFAILFQAKHRQRQADTVAGDQFVQADLQL